MEGLVEEGQEQIEEIEKGPILDAALIAAAQKVEHYEIATYGTLAALAKKLGHTEAMNLLLDTLKEEKATDEKLTLLAEQEVSEEQAGKTVAKPEAKRAEKPAAKQAEKQVSK